MLKEVVEERRQHLLMLLRKCEKEAPAYNKVMPGCRLKIHGAGKYVSYYAREKGKRTGKYLSKKTSMEMIRKLAMKDYNEKLQGQLKKELAVIDKFVKSYPEVTAEEVQNLYTQEMQKLIIPIELSDEAYIKAWQEKEYVINDKYKEHCIFTTSRGERVRSKSEVLIADTLYREKIPYHYEKPVYVSTIGECNPDFSVLNVRKRKEYIWEHFGMMSNPDYVLCVVGKLQKYCMEGYYPGQNLIVTFEDERHPLTPDIIQETIRAYLQ